MRSTIVLQVNSNIDPTPSIVSLLENTTKTNVFCVIARDNIDSRTSETVKVFLKNCCDNGNYTEEFNTNYTVATKIKDGLKLVYIVLKNYTGPDINKFAFDYFKEETDIYITANSSNVYQNKFIEKHVNKFDNPFVGAVYSDYIRNGKYIYLSSIHPLINHQIEIGDLSFNSNLLKHLKTGDTGDIINTAYSQSLVRHIPEAIFLT